MTPLPIAAAPSLYHRICSLWRYDHVLPAKLLPFRQRAKAASSALFEAPNLLHSCSQGHMYWYFEAVKAPAGNLAADQRRSLRVAASDTARLQVLTPYCWEPQVAHT